MNNEEWLYVLAGQGTPTHSLIERAESRREEWTCGASALTDTG